MPSRPSAPPSFFLRPALTLVILLAVTVLAYANSLRAPFVFDDLAVTVRNETIRSLGSAWQPPPGNANTANRPVANFTLALNYAAGGLDPRGYHAVNLLIHLLAVLTLWGLVRHTLRLPRLAATWAPPAAERVALAVALLWAVHPLQTAAVTAVAQRTESLCGLLYLLVFYLFVRGVKSPRPGRWWAGAALACLAGMGTKEVMVTAPVLLVLYDRTFVAGSFAGVWRERRRVHGLLFATWSLLAVILWQAGGTRGTAAGFGLGVEWWQYAFKQCEAILLYLRLAIVPWPLTYDHGTAVVTHLGAVWWQALLLMTLLGATGWALWRRPAVGFLGAWFFVILAPSSSVVPLVEQTVAEHRMYLPLAAVLVGGVLGLHTWLRRGFVAVVATVAMLATAGTLARNHTYRSELALWQDTAAKAPDNFRAHYNLGSVYLEAGDLTDAIASLERARQLAPDDVGVLNNLGNALLAAGRVAEARLCLIRASGLRPDSAPIQLNLGRAWAAEARWPEAQAAFSAAVTLDPGLAEAHANLGAVHLQTGDWSAARAASLQALALAPDLTVARRNLGLALLQLQRPAEAAVELERVLTETPDDATARRALAYARTLLSR
jgi:tetratricopeptide (TPR) repeat protein